MPKAFYSTVLDQSADAVWSTIRAFDAYAWAGTGVDAAMEDSAAGDQVGGVRRVETPVGQLRQRLLAHSDAERSYTYEICAPSPYAVSDYVATIRVTPVVDGNRAFVEWWARFDCPVKERDRWIDQFAHQGFAVWLESLRQAMRD
jgi:hypothetical protein